MRKMTLGQKMRWIAGGLYILLAVYQMFIMQFPIIMTPGNLLSFAQLPTPWLLGLGLIGAAAAMAVWMFAGKGYLRDGARRGVVIVTVLVLAYEWFSRSAQFEAIRYMLAYNFQMEYAESIWEIVLIGVRVLLMVLAVFFVLSAHEKTDVVEKAEEALEQAADAVLAAEDAVDEAVEEVAGELMTEAAADVITEAVAMDAAAEVVLNELAAETDEENK